MIHLLPLLLLVTLSGSTCAPRPRAYSYSWGKIIKADGNSLAKFCSDKPGLWDSGKPRPKWAPVSGCYDPKTGDIWVEDSCAGAQALTHELAHKDGIADPKAAGYNWGE